MQWNYKDLKVWQKWIQLTENIYKITNTFPKEEKYWITDQIRRCCVSIPSNIAEWSNRNSSKEFINFLYIAKWSAAELETQLIISSKIWYIKQEILEELCLQILEILKMISALITSLKK
jgi:four helix bundle protein